MRVGSQLTQELEVVCPSCRSTSLRNIGNIPASNIFAGQTLPHPLAGGRLLCCQLCSLHFRFPRLGKHEVDILYRQGASLNWQDGIQKRKDWLIARQWIKETCERGIILDVGCFDGQFLSSLDDSYDLYGIEIHQAAVQCAARKGIHIVASDFSELESLEYQFDVIVATDVLEHMYDPLLFLKNAARALRPGGAVIISTGNTQALSWQLMGSRYWYCTIAEHISFINPQWCRLAAAGTGLHVERLQFFSHCSSNWRIRIRDFGKNALYRFAPRIAAWLRARGMGAIDTGEYPDLADAPPVWISATDHMITLLRKQ